MTVLIIWLISNRHYFVLAADMFESVNKELLVHPFLQGRYLNSFQTP